MLFSKKDVDSQGLAVDRLILLVCTDSYDFGHGIVTIWTPELGSAAFRELPYPLEVTFWAYSDRPVPNFYNTYHHYLNKDILWCIRCLVLSQKYKHKQFHSYY